MKKVLLACFLGLGTIVPVTEAKSSMVIQKRVVSIHIEGWAVRASSDAASGLLQEIQIYRVNTGELVRTQSCDGYSCTCSLTGLPGGYYLAVAITTNTTAKKSFTLG